MIMIIWIRLYDISKTLSKTSINYDITNNLGCTIIRNK